MCIRSFYVLTSYHFHLIFLDVPYGMQTKCLEALIVNTSAFLKSWVHPIHITDLWFSFASVSLAFMNFISVLTVLLHIIETNCWGHQWNLSQKNFLFWPHCKWRGRWESNVNIWFRFMYSQKWNHTASYFQNRIICNVLSPNFHIRVSVSKLYIPRIGLPILLQANRQTDPGNI